MKRAHTTLMCVILLLCGYCHAQESPLPVFQTKTDKPLLFASLPDSFVCDAAALRKIISEELNAEINLQLSSQFKLIGKIVAKNQQNPTSFSVNVRLSNYHNALFNLTARLLADNSIFFQGRILHPRYGDVLVLNKERDQYFLRKQSQKFFMPE